MKGARFSSSAPPVLVLSVSDIFLFAYLAPPGENIQPSTMSPRTSILAGLALAVAVTSAAEYDDMGPAAFLWPPDRVWSASADNNAPCGSVASPGNRTEFPMRKFIC